MLYVKIRRGVLSNKELTGTVTSTAVYPLKSDAKVANLVKYGKGKR